MKTLAFIILTLSIMGSAFAQELVKMGDSVTITHKTRGDFERCFKTKQINKFIDESEIQDAEDFDRLICELADIDIQVAGIEDIRSYTKRLVNDFTIKDLFDDANIGCYNNLTILNNKLYLEISAYEIGEVVECYDGADGYPNNEGCKKAEKITSACLKDTLLRMANKDIIIKSYGIKNVITNN